jgi:3-oxoacyl-[acyl-carrier protein] reductase
MSKQIVIVGASRGIGLELVKLFAQNKDNQVLALSRKIPVDACVDLPNVSFQAFDLNDSNAREQAENLFSDLKQIDILINNAGLLVNKPFLELTHSDIQASYQTNIVGVMQTVQAAVPKMQEVGGHIVNISSMGGFQGSVKFAGLSTYSTSKAALVSFTELFAEEFKDTKIKTNCLCLGAVQTEMLAEAFPGYEAPLTATQMAEYIVDFAQNAQRYMNGKIIPVSLSTP